MSKQVSTLIEEVQYLQPSTKGSDFVKNTRIQFDDSLLALHWRRSNPIKFGYKWERNGTVEVPKFDGSLTPKELLVEYS